MSDLKPCPFCGGAVVLTDERGVGRRFRIGCYNEGCWRPGTDWYDSEAGVADAWNQRVAPAPAAAPGDREVTVDVSLLVDARRLIAREIGRSETGWPVIDALDVALGTKKPAEVVLGDREKLVETPPKHDDADRFLLLSDWLSDLPDGYCLAIWRERTPHPIYRDPEEDQQLVVLVAGNPEKGKEDRFEGVGDSIYQAFARAADAAIAGDAPTGEPQP